jgi:hypothetical protein
MRRRASQTHTKSSRSRTGCWRRTPCPPCTGRTPPSRRTRRRRSCCPRRAARPADTRERQRHTKSSRCCIRWPACTRCRRRTPRRRRDRRTRPSRTGCPRARSPARRTKERCRHTRSSLRGTARAACKKRLRCTRSIDPRCCRQSPSGTRRTSPRIDRRRTLDRCTSVRTHPRPRRCRRQCPRRRPRRCRETRRCAGPRRGSASRRRWASCTVRRRRRSALALHRTARWCTAHCRLRSAPEGSPTPRRPRG